jgi:hypothetical protein
MPLVSEAVANAKADLDRHSNEIQEWARDFLTLLSPEWHARDLVFIEGNGLQPNYIALADWSDESQMLVLQVVPPNASSEQLQMIFALTSVIASLLLRLGHLDVGVALLGENGGKLFGHEGFVGKCRPTFGCNRIPEAESQFNFSSIPGHISRSPSPVVLN